MCLKIKSLFKILCFLTVFLLFCYIVGKFDLFSQKSEQSTMAGRKILACEFEVFGIVQGVFFRKFTEETANKLGVRGYCLNTSSGTVRGQMEGEEGPFNKMKEWLTKTGSPQSKIDKATFTDAKQISDFTFAKFEIRRGRHD